jgi:hypothetical protein
MQPMNQRKAALDAYVPIGVKSEWLDFKLTIPQGEVTGPSVCHVQYDGNWQKRYIAGSERFTTAAARIREGRCDNDCGVCFLCEMRGRDNRPCKPP